jgi:hypothetical protein
VTFQPLDLQISVPRTQEFSSMQQQAAQRPITEQNILADRTTKRTEELRTQSTETENTAKSSMRTDKDGEGWESGKGRQGKKASAEAELEQPQEPAHPYKGHHLDIKL